MNLLGNTEDFVDKHAIDSIKTKLSDMIVTDTNSVGVDGPKINFKSEVRRLFYSIASHHHWSPTNIAYEFFNPCF